MAELLIGRVKRMDSLIDGILEYSRIERIEESHQQIDLDVFVCDVIDSLAPPEGVEVMIHTALPSIFANKTRMTQIFQNLIGNAVKFMNTSEEGRIDTRCFDQGEYWQFSILDNGLGIDKKYHERIFQTLQPRNERESTGIGLALVKKSWSLPVGKFGLNPSLEKEVLFLFACQKHRKGKNMS